MQFLWAWNDLFTLLVFLGGSGIPQPITVNLAGLVQSTGQGGAVQPQLCLALLGVGMDGFPISTTTHPSKVPRHNTTPKINRRPQ